MEIFGSSLRCSQTYGLETNFLKYTYYRLAWSSVPPKWTTPLPKWSGIRIWI